MIYKLFSSWQPEKKLTGITIFVGTFGSYNVGDTRLTHTHYKNA